MRQGFLTIAWRDLLRFVRFRALLFSSLVQPALWMAFFGIAMSASFDRLAPVGVAPGGLPSVNYLTFMAAGVIGMTSLFVSFYGGIVILFDRNWGLMREIMASPIPRGDIIAGIGLSVVAKSILQATLILIFGLLLGAGFFPGTTPLTGIAAYLGVMLFVAVFSFGFLCLSAAISITLESPEGLQGVITLLTMPIFFLSNALYPVDAFPPVLQALSVINPLTHLVNGIRFFAIGEDFFAVGETYHLTAIDTATSLLVLVLFAALMYGIARWRFAVARVT
ncbi:MAG: ABC transporter permease [Methanomicrobiales archaeon]|jgi:ABC-2 type transport system permease protein|nr:ABC transporter permease [Methanomicrobiales archaeon]